MRRPRAHGPARVRQARRGLEHRRRAAAGGQAAAKPVTAVDCGPDAALTIHDLVAAGDYDEIILSTAPEYHARWHHYKLPDKIQKLGVPVTVIPPELDDWKPVEGFPDDWPAHPVNPAAIAGFGNY